MKKRILLCVSIVLIALMTCIPFVSAADYYDGCDVGGSKVYIHDNADLLSDSEEEDLINDIESKCKSIEYNILFLTIDDAEGKSTMRYSDDYMDDLFADENNIAFVIDMDNREYYVNTMGHAIDVIDDSDVDKILDKGESYMADKEYYGAFSAMAKYGLGLLVKDANPMAGFGDAMVGSLPIAGLGTAAVVVILILVHNSANKAPAAVTYLANDNYKIVDKNETLVRTYETVQRGYYAQKSSSGGSSHRSSSGRSHGGGGRSF